MGMTLKIVPKGRPYVMVRLGPGWIYAEKGGGCVLRHEVSWRKISGIRLNTKWGCYWWNFRRSH
jgi:hypothetical protein